MQSNVNIIYVPGSNVRKNNVYLTLLEMCFFYKPEVMSLLSNTKYLTIAISHQRNENVAIARNWDVPKTNLILMLFKLCYCIKASNNVIKTF